MDENDEDLFTDSSDEEDISPVNLMQSTTTAIIQATLLIIDCDTRSRSIRRDRLDHNNHFELLLLESQFKQYYRMSYGAFEELLSLVGPKLMQSQIHSKNRTNSEIVNPVNKLQMTLSWLAGGSYRC